jgi:predicted nucleotidyltransferase
MEWESDIMKYNQLQNMLATVPGLELAILIGSRATGTARTESDWDIAIQWDRSLRFLEQLAASEQLRKELSNLQNLPEQAIDLIDLPTARLAMRAVVAEEGIPLKGGDSLVWLRFLQRTWRELEEHYWEQTYAA